MERVLDIVQVEHREGRHRVRDGIVGGMQGFQAQVIPRRRQHRWVPEAGDFRHFPEAHVRPHGDDAGEEFTGIRVSLTYRSST